MLLMLQRRYNSYVDGLSNIFYEKMLDSNPVPLLAQAEWIEANNFAEGSRRDCPMQAH